jgi:alkyl hydroperoxide reductase subunit F
MNNKKKIKIYSSPDCMYCYTVKGYLEDNGFEYEEINIYEDTQAYEEMKEFSGQKNVPVTVIGEEIILGWDKAKFKETLGI